MLPGSTRVPGSHMEALSSQTYLAHWVGNPRSPPPQNHASRSEHRPLVPSLSLLLPSFSHVPGIWPILLGNTPMGIGNSKVPPMRLQTKRQLCLWGETSSVPPELAKGSMLTAANSCAVNVQENLVSGTVNLAKSWKCHRPRGTLLPFFFPFVRWSYVVKSAHSLHQD